MGENFAIYRLPGDGSICNIVECGDADVLSCPSYSSVGADRGFVIAPFRIAADCPLLVLRCTQPRTADLSELSDRGAVSRCQKDVAAMKLAEDKELYMRDFRRFHAAIRGGSLRKAVLARSATVLNGAEESPLELFRRACADNPQSYVALFRTSSSGMWLTATPEILIEGNAGKCRTMALAGTRAAGNVQNDTTATAGKSLVGGIAGWDGKNLEEQQLVAEYIADRLKPFATHWQAAGPRTVRHGSVEHLRTDFSFSLKSRDITVGDVLSVLHPTPAVCGLPRQETLRMILDYEHTERQYYSGFSGPYWSERDFRFFVTLRCMKIEDSTLRLYAGGGIMSDSAAESEWQETRLKMQAMMRCLNPDVKQ